jgi:3-hydroxymyristoyl/3-hydroxydecanoyl-(acyl carrier protein) dehydratase
MQLPAPFSQEFLDDMPYMPEVLFLDRLEELDAGTSTIACRMPTDRAMPFTDHQRAHPVRHPRHFNGAVMIQLTANLGFVHAFHLESLRHRDGWIGYGTHIHRAVFRKLVTPGAPMICACTQIKVRRGRSRIFSTYRFEFRHEGEVAYESEQSAMWLKTAEGQTPSL